MGFNNATPPLHGRLFITVEKCLSLAGLGENTKEQNQHRKEAPEPLMFAEPTTKNSPAAEVEEEGGEGDGDGDG